MTTADNIESRRTRSSARSCATTPLSCDNWPTPSPTGWASTICFDCRSGCARLPTRWSARGRSQSLSLNPTG